MEKEPFNSGEDKEASKEFVEVANLLSRLGGVVKNLSEDERERAKRMIKHLISILES
ncbi:MAG: hypothetical protein HYW90_04700 [Candidatus Sungbacteria bacterium]|nr:hypothetical protein [Candidatus Sungbacteria bacterium]